MGWRSSSRRPAFVEGYGVASRGRDDEPYDNDGNYDSEDDGEKRAAVTSILVVRSGVDVHFFLHQKPWGLAPAFD